RLTDTSLEIDIGGPHVDRVFKDAEDSMTYTIFSAPGLQDITYQPWGHDAIAQNTSLYNCIIAEDTLVTWKRTSVAQNSEGDGAFSTMYAYTWPELKFKWQRPLAGVPGQMFYSGGAIFIGRSQLMLKLNIDDGSILGATPGNFTGDMISDGEFIYY